MFVDRIELHMIAGKGGDGCSSMRREKYVPRGGPDGGDGGDGASIILRAQTGVNSLAALANRQTYKATSGGPGQGSMRHGRNGKDMLLLVPPGTAVIDAEHDFVIRDLGCDGEEFVIARGGKGGRGNAHFKSATNRAPRQAVPGEMGEERRVILELKSIADVGLVGKPNAGKSTLLSRLSAARPEIADYPFTTKHPNLGIVERGDRSFVMADIPGLIEGASEGIGLGHEFLRHVERAGLLIHLVEPDPVDGTDPIENYTSIRDELEQYDDALSTREEIIVVSKCEYENASQVQETLATHAGQPVHSISAQTGANLDSFISIVLDRLDARREEAIEVSAPLSDQGETETPDLPKTKKRLPPHKAGPTKDMSNDRQAKDIVP